MPHFSLVFLAFYFAILVLPSAFGLHRYYLLFLYYRLQKRKPVAPPFEKLFEGGWNAPSVTIQLPVYNERYVAPRLIRAVCALDYPREHLEIQVLDDSNDETVSVVEREVSEWRKRGVEIHHVRRASREGFKAGALAFGLREAKGEFVAVFDADFMPHADFLKKVIPHFYGETNVGMVQTRWEHLNRDYSLLTRAQAILLDGHFIIEHTARHRSGCFFNFNGTAGVWRKSCIEDSGGWSGDTLTEDIDLSYRAQMRGWQFVYLDDVVAPAELPVDINALKTQQHRWAKGSVQVARKLLPAILRGPYPWRVKMEAFFHLAANFNYLLMAILSFLLPVSIYVRREQGWYDMLWIDLPLFLSATWSVSVFYYHSQKNAYSDWFSRVKYIFFSLALGIGLCLSNSKAVLEGLRRETGEFARTPKYAVVNRTDSWKEKRYRGRLAVLSLVEIFLTLVYAATVVYALSEGLYLSLPFLLLFVVGFGYSSFLSIAQVRAGVGGSIPSPMEAPIEAQIS
jgi:cellulose synthase/poly-beta-1,6-N-acetylglucosamine synthase-like glycosyltransferase